MRHSIHAACLLMSTVGLPALAIAATDDAAAETTSGTTASAADAAGRLEEVVVTARKRAEDLQAVPLSAQVVNAEQLAQRNHNTLIDLAHSLPGVTVAPGGGTQILSIRGIGSGPNESFDQSVGLFIDGIFHGRSRSTTATFLDVDSVEVLKGPQSTYFGNNAIAGALNINSKKPGDAFNGWTRMLYGQFGQYAIEGAVGGAISDTFTARVAATANGVDEGWIKNINLDNSAPVVRNRAARATFGLQLSESFDALLKVEGGRNVTEGAPFGTEPMQVFNCPPISPFPPDIFGGCAAYVGQPTVDSRSNVDAAGQGTELSNFESVLTLNYNLGAMQLTSVTGYYHFDYNLNFNNSGLPVPTVTTNAPEDYRQFSQELRLASQSGQTVEYLAGLYFQDGSGHYELENNFIFAGPAFFAPGDPVLAYLPLGDNVIYDQDEQSYGVFGAVTWNVTERLKLNAGLRGTWVKKDFTQTIVYGQGTRTYGGLVPLPDALQLPGGYFGQGVPGTQGGERSDDAWQPSVQATYELRPGAMLYASFAKGFKSGGFNGLDRSGLAEAVPYEPEYVRAYEVGLKSTWLDDTLRLNLALFRSNYTDLQSSGFRFNPQAGAFFSVVSNAASSRTEGVELETRWVVGERLRVGLNVAYTDVSYLSYPQAPPTLLQTSQGIGMRDASGTPVGEPLWSGSASVAYSLPIASDYRLTTDASPFCTSRSRNVDAFARLVSSSPYCRLDARVSLDRQGGPWSVDLIGNNLTDRVILTAAGGFYTASRQPPRSVALQFQYRW